MHDVFTIEVGDLVEDFNALGPSLSLLLINVNDSFSAISCVNLTFLYLFKEIGWSYKFINFLD